MTETREYRDTYDRAHDLKPGWTAEYTVLDPPVGQIRRNITVRVRGEENEAPAIVSIVKAWVRDNPYADKPRLPSADEFVSLEQEFIGRRIHPASILASASIAPPSDTP